MTEISACHKKVSDRKQVARQHSCHKISLATTAGMTDRVGIFLPSSLVIMQTLVAVVIRMVIGRVLENFWVRWGPVSWSGGVADQQKDVPPRMSPPMPNMFVLGQREQT